MKIQLKKAIKHKGQEIFTLDIPLDELTGNDLIDVEEQIMKTGQWFQATDASRVYLISLAARALHMPIEVLKQMNAHDFAKVATEVRNFLLVSDSTENEEAEIPEIHPETSSDESQ